jgi:type IV pilus assembly protein PilB
MPQFDNKSLNLKIEDLRKSEEEKLTQTLAPQYGFEYINLQGYTINPEAVALLPEEKAKEGKMIVFNLTHNKLLVGVKNPNDPITLQTIKELQSDRRNIKVYMCSISSLEHGWERYADMVNTSAKRKGVFDIDTDDIAEFIKKIQTTEDLVEQMQNVGKINNTRRATETIELIFAGAVSLGASDIHIEPEENVVRIRYRLDGVLHDIIDIDSYIYGRIMSRLKLLAGMTLNKRLEAQDGRFTFNITDREIEIRASVIPGASGESMVMRLLDPSLANLKMENIALNPILSKIIAIELKKPNGLIITTGPTGSGKTTALYTFLKETHKEGVKIITIENPVEYKLEGIVQTQTGDDYTFSSGLRAILRQDPDIIMIGEIRDREVAETAIHAAQTGHLVFTTLHTNSAVGGFPRLIDLGVDPRIIGSAINIIMGQRLVRRLCIQCKQSYQADEEVSKLIIDTLKNHPAPQTISEPVTLYKPVGCKVCGETGYRGRIGIFEAILMDEVVENVVINDPREHSIVEAAKPQGIPSMVEDGIEKVFQGITSLKELERVVDIQRTTKKQEVAINPDEKGADDDLFLANVVE